MPSNIIERVWKRGKLIQIDDLKGIVCQSEEEGHIFRISGMDADGSILPFSGTVSAVFLRPDMTDVAIAGSMSGGVASVTLPDECYDLPGRFGLTVYVSEGDAKTAIYAAVGTIVRTSTGTVAPESTAYVVDLINRLEAIIPTIPESMPGLMEDIAPTYSASAVYPVGAYCYYNGDLHRCIVPITAAESWNSAHWETAVIGDDLKGLADDLEAETEERKAAVEDLQDALYAPVESTATEITDAVPMPLESLALAMAPKQDLNGYDKPWVGGRKNLLPNRAVSNVINGITFTVNNDGTVIANGTATGGDAQLLFHFTSDDISAGNYYYNGAVGGSHTTYHVYVWDGTNSARAKRWDGSTSVNNATSDLQELRIEENVNYYLCCRVLNNSAVNNVVFTPMICASTETDATYEPYSNLCPITGWDTVTVKRTGKNLFDADTLTGGGQTSWVKIDDNSYTFTKISKSSAGRITNRGVLSVPAGTYTFSMTASVESSSTISIRLYVNGAYENGVTLNYVNGAYTSILTVPEGTTGVQIYFANNDTDIGRTISVSDVQIESGTEITAYEPYQGQTIIHNIAAAAGGTVYGGTLTVNRDGTGTLTVTHATETWDGTGTLYKGSAVNTFYKAISNGSVAGRTNSGWFTAEQLAQIELICNLAETVADTSDSYIHVSAYCGSAIVLQPRIFLPDCSTVEEAQAWLAAQNSAGHPLTWCYKLKEPQTYTLTTEQVTTLLGYNRITSDAEITGLAYYAVKPAEVDLSGKADKENSVLYGSLSLGRNILSTVGFQSTALGNSCIASETASHAIGNATTASGSASHAEGNETEASGPFSHAEGNKTIANHLSQHVFGEYNIPDDSANASYQTGNYIEIVGNGTSYARSNARTLDWLGNEKLAGSITLGMGTADEVTITPAQLKALLALLT